MREISRDKIIQEVKRLCMEANYFLPCDVTEALENAYQTEDSVLSQQTLEILNKNAAMAANSASPICQDTGMACVFVEIGQDVHVTGSLSEAIHEGVRQG